jgi:hypothetical protein
MPRLGARDHHHVDPEIKREIGRQERSALLPRLHDHNRSGERGQNAIPSGEMMGTSSGAGGKFTDEEPLRNQTLKQRCMGQRVGSIGASAQHRRRASDSIESPPMGCAINPQGHAAQNGDPLLREFARQSVGLTPSRWGGAAGSHKGHHGGVEEREMPPEKEDGGRVMEFAQPRRVAGVVDPPDFDTQPRGPCLNLGNLPSERLALTLT